MNSWGNFFPNVNCDFSLCKEIFSEDPQGSILVTLLFNIYINGIFFFVDEAFLSNYADDTALYSVEKHIFKQLILTKNSTYLQKWYYDNYMGLNPGKCYYVTFGSNTTKNGFALDGTIVPSAEEHVELRVKIDSGLTLYSHLK